MNISVDLQEVLEVTKAQRNQAQDTAALLQATVNTLQNKLEQALQQIANLTSEEEDGQRKSDELTSTVERRPLDQREGTANGRVVEGV